MGENQNEIQVAVVGDGGIGKTSILIVSREIPFLMNIYQQFMMIFLE
jgi:GTPase SAR1 family protein